MANRTEKTKLLLIDDDYQLRLLLTMLLSHLGFEVVVAEDGFSALRKMRESIPDIILSDLDMPGMSGFELLSVVRRRFPHIRVIAMSSAFDDSTIPNGIAADAFFPKENGLEDLVTVLKNTPKPSRTDGESLTVVWIPAPDYDEAGREFVTIPCQECLRTFQDFSAQQSASLQETACIHCASKVSYAIVQKLRPSFMDYTPTKLRSSLDSH